MGGWRSYTPTASPKHYNIQDIGLDAQENICRTEKRRGHAAIQQERPGATGQSSPPPRRIPEPQGKGRIVWSLIDFETCRPVITDVGEVNLGDRAPRDRCRGMSWRVFQFRTRWALLAHWWHFRYAPSLRSRSSTGVTPMNLRIVKDGVKGIRVRRQRRKHDTGGLARRLDGRWSGCSSACSCWPRVCYSCRMVMPLR